MNSFDKYFNSPVYLNGPDLAKIRVFPQDSETKRRVWGEKIWEGKLEDSGDFVIFSFTNPAAHLIVDGVMYKKLKLPKIIAEYYEAPDAPHEYSGKTEKIEAWEFLATSRKKF